MANFSTGLRDKMLDDTGFRSAMYGAKLRIFTGTVPASADAAETGTLLLEIVNATDVSAGLQFGVPVNGVISKDANTIWSTEATLAAGGMTYFRLVTKDNDESGGTSTTAPRVQGTVGLAGSDMLVTSTAITANQPWTLNYFSVTLPNPV